LLAAQKLFIDTFTKTKTTTKTYYKICN